MPVELDWASARLHAWSRNLMLDTLPRTADGFCVDLAGAAGLARHDGKPRARSPYLTTSARARARARAGGAAGARSGRREPPISGPAADRDSRRSALRLAGRHADCVAIRRHTSTSPSTSGRVAADARDLASPGGSVGAYDPAQPPAPEPGPAPLRWRVSDRSAAGWRISAPGGVGQGLALGALVALCCADDGEWMLGVVSRLAKGARGGRRRNVAHRQPDRPVRCTGGGVPRPK